jgi:hypothetical protein
MVMIIIRSTVVMVGTAAYLGVTIAMAESAVNQIISKRFVKKQQMKWSKRGAHLLLQVRTQVLNGDLRDRFCRWYPGMKTEEEPAQRAA